MLNGNSKLASWHVRRFASNALSIIITLETMVDGDSGLFRGSGITSGCQDLQSAIVVWFILGSYPSDPSISSRIHGLTCLHGYILTAVCLGLALYTSPGDLPAEVSSGQILKAKYIPGM